MLDSTLLNWTSCAPTVRGLSELPRVNKPACRRCSGLIIGSQHWGQCPLLLTQSPATVGVKKKNTPKKQLCTSTERVSFVRRSLSFALALPLRFLTSTPRGALSQHRQCSLAVTLVRLSCAERGSLALQTEVKRPIEMLLLPENSLPVPDSVLFGH